MTTGMSSERLQQIDTMLTERFIRPGYLTGALTLVHRRGETAHFSPLGLMDRERGKPTTEDTIYRIYSMSKPITSVALMMLYEKGLFQLGDPVGAFLPEWNDARVYRSGEWPNFDTVAPDRPMTVRDLLTHQSGLGYGMDSSHPADLAHGQHTNYRTSGKRMREWSKALAQIPLLFSPSAAWNYSVSTDMCGCLVEAISGQPFDVFLREQIFEPLGMVDTAFCVPPDKRDRFAACYEPDGNGGIMLQDDPADSAYLVNPVLPSGGGGLVSTAGDYLRFCRMLLNGGTLDGERIIGPKTIELMTGNHLSDGKTLAQHRREQSIMEPSYGGSGFGLGFKVILDAAQAQGSLSAGSYMWSGAAGTGFWIDPVEDMIVVFMTQLMRGADYPARRILGNVVYAAIED